MIYNMIPSNKVWDLLNNKADKNSVPTIEQFNSLDTTVTGKNGLVQKIENKENKAIYRNYNLIADNWKSVDDEYEYDSLSIEYPAEKFNIEISFQHTNEVTKQQYQAFIDAEIVGRTDNNIVAYGDKPIINIPVLIKVVEI